MKKMFVYFYILKTRQYVTLLCICGNYKIFIFPTRVYCFRSFSNNRQFRSRISTVGFRFRPDQKIWKQKQFSYFFDRFRLFSSLAGIGPAEMGRSFPFYFFISLFFFLNPFSPLYKYSFIFPRCLKWNIICECY